jgi:hypothetical protein
MVSEAQVTLFLPSNRVLKVTRARSVVSFVTANTLAKVQVLLAACALRRANLRSKTLRVAEAPL